MPKVVCNLPFWIFIKSNEKITTWFWKIICVTWVEGIFLFQTRYIFFPRCLTFWAKRRCIMLTSFVTMFRFFLLKSALSLPVTKPNICFNQNPVFRHASVSSTYPSPSVSPWYFQISILSASLRPHKAMTLWLPTWWLTWRPTWQPTWRWTRWPTKKKKKRGMQKKRRRKGTQFDERVGHGGWLIGPKLCFASLFLHTNILCLIKQIAFFLSLWWCFFIWSAA